jgi:PhnB protein
MNVQPYLFFEGRCEEAIEFYKRHIDAQVVMLMRNREAPDKPPPGMLQPGSENKVMHASLRIGDATVMASDGRCSGKAHFAGFSLSLGARDDAHAKRLFDALAEGGSVTMPLGKTFFASSFGMVTDRFGVPWMVIAESKPPA